MAKTELLKQNNKDIYLFSTNVENLFINELLPEAPGDYVKVYLIGLMCAEYALATSREKTANLLGMSSAAIEEAWTYWEKRGAVRREYTGEDDGSYRILFLSQIEALYGTQARRVETASPEDVTEELADRELKGLFDACEQVRGALLSTHEIRKITDAVKLYHITPDVFSYAIKYCAELGKTSIDYIFKVARSWKEQGCTDIGQVKALLDASDKRNAFYRRVFAEMGFNRIPTPAEREMMDRWFDEFAFGLEEVLNACRLTAGHRDPSLRYVNKVLENKALEAGGIRPERSGAAVKSEGGAKKQTAKVSKKVLEAYYGALREEEEAAQQQRQAEAVAEIPLLEKVLQMEQELNKGLIDFDFSPKGKELRKQKRAQKKALEEEKQKILKENGYPEDHLELHHRCKLCKDTGIGEDGRYCSCARIRAEEAYTWNKKRTQ